MDPKEEIRISKLLAYILRHGAQKEKLTIRSDGYIKVSNLTSKPKLKDVTLKQIKYIVEHKLESLTKALSMVICGTTLANWSLIKQSEGLSKMNRNHIHLATGLPNYVSVQSGVCSSSQVYIYIDMENALNG
ncbi:unnamed protein product [Cunninghamella blakesleeana]